jgi:hypothetical protein
MNRDRSFHTVILGLFGAALGGCGIEPGGNATEAEAVASVAQAPDGSSASASRLDDDHCAWTQWGQSAAHDGQACVRGQAPTNVLHHVVYDPFEFQEMSETFGDLFIHYQVPLNDDDNNFYMMQKGGTYTSCDPPGSGTPAPCGIDPANIVKQTWSENKYHRRANGARCGRCSRRSITRSRSSASTRFPPSIPTPT